MRALFVVCSLFLLAACGGNEVAIGSRTTAEFDEIYNAGTVAKGELVKVKIKLTNSGDKPMVISEVEAGCSCTSTKKPDAPIKPGDSGYVEATIDTGNFGIGKFSRDVRIVANTTPSPLVVSMQGEVIQ